MKLLLKLSALLVMALPLLGQSVSIKRPNDGSTGTTLHKLAMLSTAGAAIQLTTSNTTVPAYVVTSGAGITGTAVLSSSGSALCIMDASITSAGGAYITASTTTAGECHPSTSAPTSGTWVVGYLQDNSTTSGSPSLINVQGYSFPSSGGGPTMCVLTPSSDTITNPYNSYFTSEFTSTNCAAIFAANALSAGRHLEIEISGTQTTTSTGNGTFQYGFKWGGIAFEMGNYYSQNASQIQDWNIRASCDVITAGSSGKLWCSGIGGVGNVSGANVPSLGYISPGGTLGNVPQTFDTTVAGTFQIGEFSYNTNSPVIQLYSVVVLLY